MPRKGAKLSQKAAERQKAAIKAWHEKNTEILKFTIRIRKGYAGAYRELAAARGESLTSIIRDYLNAECEKEGIDTQQNDEK